MNQIIPANANLIDLLPKVEGNYRENADLSKINWFNVGGKAEVMFRPKDANDLANFLKNVPKEIDITILGVGSNLLVRDGGIKGVTIRLGRGFTDVSCQDNKLSAGAGALSFNVANFACENGLGGVEFLVGIPGTIGGALAMNAGSYGNDVSSVLESAELVDIDGNIHNLSVSDIGYIYRGNTLPENMIFTKGIFQGKTEDPKVIKERLLEITQKRETSQPIKTRTSGSTFKNPTGHKAWELIDKAGCRGLQIGGAQISEKHCNFMINTGNATAADLENLGEEVRKKVKASSGIELEWEIKIIGEK